MRILLSRHFFALSILLTTQLCSTNIVFMIDPVELLIPQRLDIIAKYLYAKNRELDVKSDWATRLYSRLLHVWNNCQEPLPRPNFPHFKCAQQHRSKSTINDYTAAFDELLDSIKTDGFNQTSSVVPVGPTLRIMDGAHRIAAGLLYHKKVPCSMFMEPKTHDMHDASSATLRQCTNYVSSGLEQPDLDILALEYCKLKKNTYMVCIYPRVIGKDDAAIELILNEHGAIVHTKKISVTQLGVINLMRYLYSGDSWIGSVSDNFWGARQKAACCFVPAHQATYSVMMYLVESKSLDEIKRAKKRIRDFFIALDPSVTNNSLHINDTHEETLRIAQAVFNDNSLHLLNYAQPKQFARFERFIADYKQWIAQHKIDSECLCIDGSAVLSAYGIRDCNDLDVLHHGYEKEFASTCPRDIGSHNEHTQQYYVVSYDDLIFNPKNHFYYQGLKFVSLPIIMQMKIKRNEAKDRSDVAKVIQSIASI